MTQVLALVALGYSGFAIYRIWTHPAFLAAGLLCSYALAVYFGPLGGILGLTAVFAVLCRWAVQRGTHFIGAPGELPLLLWVGFSLVSIFASWQLSVSFTYFSALLLLGCGSYLFGRTFGGSDQFISNLFAGSVAILLICAPAVVMASVSPDLNGGDLNSVGLAVLLEVPLNGALAILLFSSTSPARKAALLALVLFVILPLSFVLANRGVILAAGCAFLLFLAIRISRPGGGRVLLYSAAGLAVVVGVVALLWIQFAETEGSQQLLVYGLKRLTTNVNSVGGLNIDPSASARLELYSYALDLISQAPIFGHGIGSFAYLTNSDAYPHNMFLEILVDTGFAGLTLFLCFLVPVLWKAFRDAWRQDASWQTILLAGLIVESLVRFQVSMSITTAKQIFLFAGIVSARWASERYLSMSKVRAPASFPVAGPSVS